MRNKDANLTDLVNLVAERTGISVNKTKGIVAEVLQGVIQLTEDHGALAIRSFGRFDKRVKDLAPLVEKALELVRTRKNESGGDVEGKN